MFELSCDGANHALAEIEGPEASSWTTTAHTYATPLSSKSFSLYPSSREPLQLSSLALTLTLNGKNVELYEGETYVSTTRTNLASAETGTYTCELTLPSVNSWPITFKVLSVPRDALGVKPSPILHSITVISTALPQTISPPPAPDSQSQATMAAVASLQEQMAGLNSFTSSAIELVSRLKATVDAQGRQIIELQEQVKSLQKEEKSKNDSTAC
jgi:hypothetical protein